MLSLPHRHAPVASASGVLAALGPRGLVLVGEPHQLGVKRADELLALGARLVELAEEDRGVTASTHSRIVWSSLLRASSSSRRWT